MTDQTPSPQSVVVPVEPTEAMIEEGRGFAPAHARSYVGAIYKAMLAAAPAPSSLAGGEAVARLTVAANSNGSCPGWIVVKQDDLRAILAALSPEAREGDQPVDGDWQSIAMWMGFAASVIKSGEPWTDQCQREFGEAKAAYGRLSALPAAPSADKLRIATDAFDAITDLGRALRSGGPDSSDLNDLSDNLDSAVNIAAEALANQGADQ